MKGQLGGGAKIGSSSLRSPHDQKLPFEEEVLRENASDPPNSQESSQTSQQTQDRREKALHINHFAR